MEDRKFAANELADLDKKISRQNTESAGNLNEWEKVFSNHLSNKWSVLKMCQKLMQFSSKKTKNTTTILVKKWAKDLNKHFTQRSIQIGQQVQEKMLNITHHQGNANQNHSETGYREERKIQIRL